MATEAEDAAPLLLLDDAELWETFATPRDDSDREAADGGCIHCGSTTALDLEDGNVVCRACDTVNTRHLDSTAEWRCFGGGETDSRSRDMKRCCGTMSGGGGGAMGSSIVVSVCSGGGGGRGRKRRPARVPAAPGGRGDLLLSPQSQPQPHADDAGGSAGSSKDAGSLVLTRMMQRVHIWNSMTHRERSLLSVFETLRVQAANNGIPRCILEEAKAWYKATSEGRIMRGENRDAVIACSIYVACKANDVPRSVREIASIFNVRPAAMTKAFNAYVGARDVAVTHSEPSHFVARFCCRLELAAGTVRVCARIVKRAEEGGILEENTPPTLVSGAILMACAVTGETYVTKERIAEVTQTRPTTVAKCYKRLLLHKDELLR